MARLRAAGLNPNLVYGNGATTEAAAVRGTPTASWNPQAPDFSALANINPLAFYQDYRQKQATTNNLEEQLKVIREQAGLTNAQALKTLEEMNFTKSQHKQFNDLKDTALELQKTELESKKQAMMLDLQANERAALQNSMSLATGLESILNARIGRSKTAQEITNLKATLDNIKKDSELKELDAVLKRLGIQPGDNAVIRAAAQLLNNTSVQGAVKDVGQKLKFMIGANLPPWLVKLLVEKKK